MAINEKVILTSVAKNLYLAQFSSGQTAILRRVKVLGRERRKKKHGNGT